MGIGDAKAQLARAYAAGEQPKLVAVMPAGRDEAWMLGGVLFLLPVVPNDAPPELEYALRLRRDASLTGTCENCGASFGIREGFPLEGSLRAMQAVVPHRGNCPAADGNVAPLHGAYYKSKDEMTWSENIDAASRRTKEKLEEALKNAVTVEQTYEAEEWAKGVLDKNLKLGKRCAHLGAQPAQTWNVLLDDGTFKCDECWAYLEREIVSGRFRLPLIDEFTCDKCRRYSSSLSPLVLRISNFVLRGGICRRCAGSLQVPRQAKGVD